MLVDSVGAVVTTSVTFVTEANEVLVKTTVEDRLADTATSRMWSPSTSAFHLARLVCDSHWQDAMGRLLNVELASLHEHLVPRGLPEDAPLGTAGQRSAFLDFQ